MKAPRIHTLIQRKLKKIGVQLKKIGMNEITMIADRDLHDTAMYDFSLLPKYGKNISIVSFFIAGQHVGYCSVGYFMRNDRKIGDIGMLHISPPVRNLGLGSLICFIQYRFLMESNPDLLYCEIADKTGKIYHILKELKFTDSGETSKKGAHPIWMREFLSATDRNTFKKELESAIDVRIMKLSNMQNKLHTQAVLVDVDNPDIIDFEKTVLKRLRVKKVAHPLETVTLFGYRGSKIRLVTGPVNFSKDNVNGYMLILEVAKIDILLAKNFLEANNSSLRYQLREKKHGKLRITTPLTWDIIQLKKDVEQFAKIGKKLLTFTH